MNTATFSLHSSIIALAAAALAVPVAAEAQTAPQPARPAPPPASDAPAGPIVVTGNRSEVISTPDRTSFSVANDLQVQTGTVADALRSVPGVEVNLQGQVSLRGDPGVTILIDGRPSAMLRGENRGDVLLSMPAGQIERVEVITNPSAAMSPEGSGGVINLVTKQVRKDTRSGTVRVTAGPGGRGGLNLSGAQSGNGLTLTGDAGYRRMTGDQEAVQLRSRLDPATGTFVSSRQDSDAEQVMSMRTGRVGVEYDLNKKNRLSTDFNYREGKIDVERLDEFTAANPNASFDRLSDIDLSQRGLGARATWRHTLGKEHDFVAEVEAESARQRREVEAETDFTGGQRAFESILNAGERGEYSVRLDYKKPMGKEASLALGYHGNMTEAEFEFVGSRGASLDAMLPIPGLGNEFEYDQTVHALFGTYRFPIGTRLDAQTGLRLEQVETRINQITDAIRVDRDYFRVYPTLHLSYELSKTEQLRASYSRRIQRPSPQDLNPYTIYIDPLNLRRGNPFLLPEVTDSFETSIQHRKKGNFYSLTGFYRRSRGGVTDVISDIGGGVFLTTRANLATAERVGAELVANGKFSKEVTYNASATLLWNEIDPRIGGVSMPRSGTTGTVRGTLNWQPSPKDFFQFNGFYSGKQLLPQGFRRSGAVLNLGYRRKVNDKLSLLVTGQNVLDSARQVTVFETPTLRDRLEQKGTGRVVLFGLTYNLGGQTGKKRPEPGFDFSPGTGETPQ
jgi:outer membrane receptor protein involved in Fe transport